MENRGQVIAVRQGTRWLTVGRLWLFAIAAFGLCSSVQSVSSDVRTGATESLLLKEWERTFGGTSWDELRVVRQTRDGGYILGGYSSFLKGGNREMVGFNNSYDYWVVKTDSTGAKIWEGVYGGDGGDWLFSLEEAPNGGYVLGGESYSETGGNKRSPSFGKLDYWVVRIDAQGKMLWDVTFGGGEWDQLKVVRPTRDGGFILGGNSSSGMGGSKSSINFGESDYWVIKLDVLGNKEWEANLGGKNSDELGDLQETSDGGFIIGGSSSSGVSGNKISASFGESDFWVVKVDHMGHKEWEKAFGGSDGDYLAALQRSSDGGYILGGESWSGANGNKSSTSIGGSDLWLVKLRSNGDKEWDKSFGDNNSEELHALVQTGDEGYVIGGSSPSRLFGQYSPPDYRANNGWIVKVRANGTKEQEQTFGGAEFDTLYSLEETSDGGLILGAVSESDVSGNKTVGGFGEYDYWIVKLASRSAPAGTPVILVNGFYHPTNRLVITDVAEAQLQLKTSFPTESIRYSLDGTDPRFGSTYSTSLIMRESVRIRSIAFDALGNESGEEGLEVELLSPPALTVHAVTLEAESCRPVNGAVDSGEIVTVSIALMNNGNLRTSNLVASLTPSENVRSPSERQNYGIVSPGRAVARSFSFRADGVCARSIDLVLQLQDGSTNYGFVASRVMLGESTAGTTTAGFTNAAVITIPRFGMAETYPSRLEVNGVSTQISRLTVTLSNLTHTEPSNLDILFVGPRGQGVMLMSDAGNYLEVTNVTLVFDQGAAATLPRLDRIVSGSFKPTNYEIDSGFEDRFPLPALHMQYSTNLSVFNGTDPNGVWELYIIDDAGWDEGAIAGSWSLEITSSARMCCDSPGNADLSLAVSEKLEPRGVEGTLTYTLAITNGGPAGASGVILSSSLPLDVAFLSALTSQGACREFSGTVFCELGTVPPGASASVSIRVQPLVVGPFTNRATVSANEIDPNTFNNSVASVTPVSLSTVSIENTATGESEPYALVRIHLSFPVVQTVIADFATWNGSALAGSDFLGTNGTIVFSPGVTNLTLSIPLLEDLFNEADETFTIVLTNATFASLGTAHAVVRIVDNDPLPVFAISDSFIVEGNTGTNLALFTVSLSRLSGRTATVDFAASGITASSGSDFLPVEGTLTFPPGISTQTIAVPVIGDWNHEAEESFSVKLTSPLGGSLGDGTGLGTIVDDDSVEITGTGAVLTGEFCQPGNGFVDSGETVRFEFSLRNIGIRATSDLVATLVSDDLIDSLSAPQSYGALFPSGSSRVKSFLFVAHGSCGQTITVTLRLSDGFRDLGTVSFPLPLGVESITSSIFRNETPIEIGISDVANPYPSPIVVSGLPGTLTKATVTLRHMSHSAPKELSVLLVAPNGESVDMISKPSATGIAQATLTFDDDVAAKLPFLAPILSGTYKPSGNGQYASPAPLFGNVLLSALRGSDPNGTWQLFVVDNGPAGGGAIEGGWSLKLWTSQSICCQDSAVADLQLSQQFSADAFLVGRPFDCTLVISNRGPATATSVIVSNILSPAVMVLSLESSQGTCTLRDQEIIGFLGTLPSQTAATVRLRVAALTAGSFTNLATVTSEQVDTELVNNIISSAFRALTQPELSIDDVALFEGDFGLRSAVFIVRLFPPTSEAVTVDYFTSNDFSSEDYLSTNGTITFSSGETHATVSVRVIGDTACELDNTFFLSLTNAMNAVITRSKARGTILTDDYCRTVYFFPTGFFPPSTGPIDPLIVNFGLGLGLPAESACGVITGSAGWLIMSSSVSGFYRIDTQGTGFDTRLAFFEGRPDEPLSLMPMACNDNAGNSLPWSQVTVQVQAGRGYSLLVGSTDGSKGSIVINRQLLREDDDPLFPPGRFLAPLRLNYEAIVTNGGLEFHVMGMFEIPTLLEWTADFESWRPIMFWPPGVPVSYLETNVLGSSRFYRVRSLD